MSKPLLVLLASTQGGMLLRLRHLGADLPPTAKRMSITELAEQAPASGGGIGRLLVETAAQAARSAGCGALELVTPSGELSLPVFGRALGFVEAGSRIVRALRKRR
jgi:GNAT superfamily N-acetyltransferase